jgi:hypothetical protein
MTIELFDCVVCQRRIGPQRTHYITETNKVVCGDCCVFTMKSTTPAHAQLYPDCPVDWHDLWDHQFMHATSRAGARWWLDKQETK